MFRKIFFNSLNICRNGNINIYARYMRADKLTKALGQHILINPGIIDTVLKKCEISFCYLYNYKIISLII